ncbi:MAG: SoxR reducing system RseC family protein [Clostridia bacterium]|nr:SoxR reducing system RseC family protein [Clostridia bacterium]
MRAEGKVVAVNGDVATVSVIQQSACAGCGASCANCHKKVEHCVDVDNTIGAVVGEDVWVESSSARIVALSVLLFVLPTVVAGAFCALMWGRIGQAVLSLLTLAVAAVCFSCLYLTAGRRIAKSNTYTLVKKY